MSGVNPAHTSLALIREAEDFVANEKKLEAIQEAARVAAELKAKQEAETKAAAELKAKQEADAKAAAELKAKQEAEAKAAAELKAKLAAEVKAAAANKKTAAAKAKANPKTTTAESTKALESSAKIVLTSEGQLVANNFRANKGKLPWPVEKGAVSLPYGDQPHPVYRTLTVHNSGVEITTENGASARSVFGGEVTKVIKLSPLNIAVFIQHGDYFTVYQNLISVNVSVGDKVSTKQSIGKIRTNGDTGKTILKFLILQNTTYNNPASWLFNM
jgi:septal ring factor EnvC (AmiA/AmiB activator)